MSTDQLPPEFTPYHLVSVAGDVCTCEGKFHDKTLALETRDFFRRLFIDKKWNVLAEEGVVQWPGKKTASFQLRFLNKAA